MRTLDAIASGSSLEQIRPPLPTPPVTGKPSLDDISTRLTDSHAPYAVSHTVVVLLAEYWGNQLTTCCWLDSLGLALGAGRPVLSHLEHRHLSSCPITSIFPPG